MPAFEQLYARVFSAELHILDEFSDIFAFFPIFVFPDKRFTLFDNLADIAVRNLQRILHFKEFVPDVFGHFSGS